MQQNDSIWAEITLDRGIYDALASIDQSKLDDATKYFLHCELAYFRRGGVDREPETRKKVKALKDELTAIGQEFDKNINSSTKKIEFLPGDLDGLPTDYVKRHPVGADGKVIITTAYPDNMPFMTYARSAAAREKLYRAYATRAYPENVAVLSRLLEKRYELATLLGYPSWAALAMEDKMIRTPEAAHEFIDKIAAASDKRAQADYQLLLAELRKTEPRAKAVPRWSVDYLSNRVRATQLNFDEQSVRPYFEFTRVKAGILDLASTLFAVQFRRVEKTPVWHEDVEVYDVFDGDRQLGRIYLDLHPRADKYTHAAQFNLVGGKEGYRLPEGVLLCNFPKPGAVPALMSHEEVKTFFHEFGHLMQEVLAGHTHLQNTNHIRERDFVEAPSQFLEEWVDDAETLQRFAHHYETNAPIPTELVRQMVHAEDFGRGLDVRRQMHFAAVSLRYYDQAPQGLDTTKVYEEMEARYVPFPSVPGVFRQLSFGHLNGYSSNYYTYMWSLVIAKDLLTPFRSAGMLDPTTAARYRHMVLEPCGTKPPAELVRDFLGRPFSFDAYASWLNGRS